MYNLACCYKKGYGVEADIDKAKHWYLKSAGLGHAGAQNKLALLYSEDLKSYRDANKWFKRAMEQNNPNAYYNYAWMLWYGKGVKNDKGKAIEMMQQAVSLGCSSAEKGLSEMLKGDVIKAVDKAVDDTINKEIDNAYKEAIKGNFNAAIPVYKKYANEGNARAMAYYGLCLLHGTGVKKYITKGKELLTNAAEAGNAFACCRLVETYLGVDPYYKIAKANIDLANKFLDLAKKAGADKNEIKKFEELITPRVKFTNIKVIKDVTVNKHIGFEVSGNLIVNGLIGETIEFSAYVLEKSGSKKCLNSHTLLPNIQIMLKAESISTIWGDFSFFIPYKDVVSSLGFFDKCIYIIVWHKSGAKFEKLLQEELPFHISVTKKFLRSKEYAFTLVDKKSNCVN